MFFECPGEAGARKKQLWADVVFGRRASDDLLKSDGEFVSTNKTVNVTIIPRPVIDTITIERNPLRANLVKQVETWRWSSLWHRMHGTGQEFLDDSWLPVERDEWLKQVDRPGSEAELAALRRSLLRGAPFGDATWRERTAERLGLESTLRPRGRPRLGTAQLG